MLTLEEVAARFDGARRSGTGYSARCLSREDRNPSLSIWQDKNGRIRLKDHAGRTTEEAEMEQAGLHPRDLDPAWKEKTPLTLGELAQDKGLPVSWLAGVGVKQDGDAVRIEYRREDGKPAARQRIRTALAAKDGSFWSKGKGATIPYGEWRLAEARERGFALLVEGESDCWSAWYHDFPALGLPGADTTGKLEARHLRGVGRLYVLREPDAGGAKFSSSIARRLERLAWSGGAFALTMPDGLKDLNDLHKRAGSEFDTALATAMANAAPLEATGAVSAAPVAPRPTEEQPPRPRAVTRRLCDVEPEAVEWLWLGRIPQGKLTVLDGDPGLGKSLVTLDLTARVTSGAAMPDGQPNGLGAPAGVVLVGVEDGIADTVVPRLHAAGADLARVLTLDGVRLPRGEADDGPAAFPTIADVAALEEAIREVDARLMVIDPLTAFLPSGCDSHNDAEVRGAMSPLCPLAERTDCAILVVRHLNKSAGGAALYRGGGSIAIVGIARSAMVVAPDPTDEEGLGRVLAMTKSNLAAPAPSLTYRIEAAPGAAVVRWGEASELTADQLLAPPKRAADSVSPERAALIGLLEGCGEALDAQRIAQLLGWPQPRVRYHLKAAVDAGQIERVATGMYRACAKPHSPSRPHITHNPHSSVGDEGDGKQATCEDCERCEPVRARGDTPHTPPHTNGADTPEAVFQVAAGLEFPHVVVPGHGTVPRGREAWLAFIAAGAHLPAALDQLSILLR